MVRDILAFTSLLVTGGCSEQAVSMDSLDLCLWVVWPMGSMSRKLKGEENEAKGIF